MNVKFINMKDHSYVEVRIDGEHYDNIKVRTDEEGREYILVPNFFRHEGDAFMRGSFVHRIGDMVTHIRNGWGDVISHTHLFTHSYTLLRFLDRSYGEDLRKKSIEGWKDAQFAWAVFMRNSLFGDAAISVKDDLKPLALTALTEDSEKFRTKFYETEAEAQGFINGVLSRVKPIAEEYWRICGEHEDAPGIDEFYKKNITGMPFLERSVFDLSKPDKDVMDDDLLYAGQTIKRDTSKFDSRPVFTAYYNLGNMDGYLCKGDALSMAGEDSIYEETLRYKLDDGESLFKDDADEVDIYRVECEDMITAWYRMIDECFTDPKYDEIVKYAKDTRRSTYLRKMSLHKQELFPIEPSPENPYQMLFEERSRGLVSTANLRPDEIGKYTPRKKFYFPDRSCADKLCAGMVNVTKVIDRGNYGFVVGEMVKFSKPEEGDDLAEYLLDNFVHLQIQFIENPFWGSAIRLTNPSSKSDRYIVVDPETSKITTADILEKYDHSQDIAAEEPIGVLNYLCQGYTDKSFDELCNVTRCDEFYRLRPLEHPSTFYSEDFDEAIGCGLIELCRFSNTNLCFINPEYMGEAAFRLGNGLSDVMKKVDEINKEARAKYASLKKKGKI